MVNQWTQYFGRDLPENEREYFEERAAIYQFEGGFLPQRAAELAARDTREKFSHVQSITWRKE